MELQSDLKIAALQKAKEIYDDILKALKTPTKSITGESLRVYEEMEAWGFFEHYSLMDEKNAWLYVNLIATQQYRHLRWKRDHPTPSIRKKSKWEVVNGAMGKKTRG